ncbi:MAG: methylmalonyl Co-A mutase-associated GTPase MeaB [Ignavibacteriae bacterium]|nr:methylmalonyl Co-A mutase-associated GTPase MeaB [Ignavibacteriota bacterium]
MTDTGRTPEWAEPGTPGTFASTVMKGVEGGHDGLPGAAPPVPGTSSPARPLPAIEEYIAGVRGGDRVMLARAITLIESNAPAHADPAREVLTRLLPFSGKAIRVGVTGVPGAGKSTFIEALGLYLTGKGHRVAVLAVDPSSSISRGSVLGDKTRMERLARDERCFIRPSPSGGNLGGVARKTRETMLLCEAAGYDVILVETVGVGQSEITVRSMVDFFLLLLITGAGDELQGIKKGVMELADLVAINKADGENRTRAETTRAEFAHALHFLTPATEGWAPPTLTCSALTGEGVPALWEKVEDFRVQTTASGVLANRRNDQLLAWLHGMVGEHLRSLFYAHPSVAGRLPAMEQQVVAGTITAAAAAQELIRHFEQRT